MKKLFVAILLFMCSFGYAANVTLTADQYKKIVDRLKEDKELLQKNDDKWDKLRKQVPEIDYKVIDNTVVVEKIIINVDKDTPLEYLSEFKVIMKNDTEGFFPLKLRLYGGAEFEPVVGAKVLPDVKLALKLFGLKPLKAPVVQNFGLNACVGIQSFGLSLSYDLPHPLSNTAIHLFWGYSYALKPHVGAGVTLNF